MPDPDDVIHDLETIKPGGNVESCSNGDAANREAGAGESNGSWTTVELVVSAKGSPSSVWDWESCSTTRRVGASDEDSCIGSDMGNLERELVVKAGGGAGKGGGVSVLDGASWKRVLPDSPLVPLLCPEAGLNLCGRSMGLELGPGSVPGSG